MDNNSISLNKYLSSTGMCSRREADKWIEEGLVSINGITAKKGNRVLPGDNVKIKGKTITKKAKPVYILFNKPPGITSTTDLKDKSNIIYYINYGERIFPIGRLDKNSSGLILLTNDGDIVNKILRKENKHEKEYIVTVDRPITQKFLKTMSGPIPMLGTRTLPSKVIKLKPFVFRIILTQGLNRQIRRMCEYCGYKVLSLKRVRIMHIKIGNLKPGQWRPLSKDELTNLFKAISH